MSKKTFRLKRNMWADFSKSLIIEFGLPKVFSSSALYFYDNDNVYGLNFINSRCFFDVNYKKSSHNLKTSSEDFYKKRYPIELENKNIKSFLMFLTTIGPDEAFIGDELINIIFNSRGLDDIKIILDTPLGDIVVVRNINQEFFLLNYGKYIDGELSKEYIDDFFIKNTKREKIFDKSGILHHKIIKYADTHGISMKPFGESNIKNILSAKSNDYTKYEDVYQKILGEKFSKESDQCNNLYFKPISIIIPVYKSEKTILKTLYSIESQNIKKDLKSLIDVIIIDDGNINSLYEQLKNEIIFLSFSIRFVRFEKNLGLSNARNVGVKLSKYSRILFLDSDIILSSNYLYEHSICMQLFPNCLFISMKKNVSETHEITQNNLILKGVKVPDCFDDKRVFKKSVHEGAQDDTVVESLSETNLYKNFGYGRIVTGYDLPSVVIGHNMSMNKNLFNRTGGFSPDFKGWGMEDTFFGAKFIAKGGFIIPLLKTGVYHIEHEPRSGSEKNREKELEQNLEIYKRYIENNYE